MCHGRRVRRILLVGVLLASVIALQGCNYAEHRWNDFTQLLDLGLTLTKTPQFSAYINCPTIAPIGYGKIDGYYIGSGDNQSGFSRHKRESVGLLFWGRETTNWKAYNDRTAGDELSVRDVGVIGLATSDDLSKTIVPVCIHYLHIGFVGVVWNINWLDVPDFFMGFAGLDPLGDDGPNGGWWFWRSRTPKSAIVKADTEAPPAVATKVAAASTKPDNGSNGGWWSTSESDSAVWEAPEPAERPAPKPRETVRRTRSPSSGSNGGWWPWRPNRVIEVSNESLESSGSSVVTAFGLGSERNSR